MRGEVRKIAVNRLIRDEKGYILILALLVLVLVGLISGPLLSYMVSGLRAGHVFETGAAELYAADAGVEDAVWNLQLRTDKVTGLTRCNDSTSYPIANVNDKSVVVTITWVYNTTDTITYLVESTATSDGSETKIDAYINGDAVAGDFSGITNNVITSLGKIILKPGTEVYPPEGEEHGQQDYYDYAWPTPEELCDWYWWDVRDATHYYSDTTIDLNGVSQELGPLYVNGTLTIKNSSSTPATLTLNGTIYATGKTQIYGPTSNEPYKLTLDLNDYTIFVSSNITGAQNALEIQKCNMNGSGAIIAVGDIYFAPKVPAGMTDPVFIMSISGETLVQPNGEFYGSIAGSIDVQLQPGSSINFPESGLGVINFPGCIAGRFIYSIDSWEVSRH
jgi:Tfp pilus assembly protein PilX